jgi:sugar lactone lactonase YvrE
MRLSPGLLHGDRIVATARLSSKAGIENQARCGKPQHLWRLEMLRIDWINRWTRRAAWLVLPAALCLMALPGWAQGSSYVPPVVATSINTVPATGLPGSLGDVALDACGNIYTANQGSGQVVEIPYGGGAATTVLAAASYGTTSLWIDSAKTNLFVLQGYAGSISKIPITSCAPETAAQSSINIGTFGAISWYWGGSDLATDSTGNLFISTKDACCASKNELLELTTSSGYASGAQLLVSLDNPITSMAFDSSNNLYYVSGGALYELAVTTAATSKAAAVYSPTPVAFGGTYVSPVGVASDAAGNLYVADQGASEQSLYASSVLYVIPNETTTTTTNGTTTTTSALNPKDQYVVVQGSGESNPLTFTNTFAIAPSGGIYFTGNTAFNASSGNAVYAATPFTASFGSVAVGGTGTATVNLAFNAAATPASITFASHSAFTSTGGTCAANTAYTNGQSCTINAQFAPTRPGVSVGGITVAGADNSTLAATYLSGTGLGAGITLDSGTVTSAGSGFASPQSVAFTPSGVFIADAGANAVLEFATSTSSPVTIGTGLSKPSGVAVDGVGNVIIADTGNNQIVEVPVVNGALSNAAQATIVSAYVVDSKGNKVATPIAGAVLSGPAGVTVDPEGNLYIADTGNNRIVYVPYNGSWNVAGASVLGSDLTTPLATTVDPSGNVYVADSGSGQVYRLQAPVSSGIQQLVAVGYSNPSALAADASGSLFVVDQGAQTVVRIPYVAGALDPNAAVEVGFGIANPYGLALDSSGNLIVTDAQNAGAFSVNRINITEAFGDWALNTPSGALPVKLENAGNQALIFASPFSTSSGDTGDFSLSSSPSSACADGGTVATGAGCELDATFQPTASGARSETLLLNSNAVNASAEQVVLTGNGAAGGSTTTVLAITSPANGNPFFGEPVTLTATVKSAGGTPSGSSELLVDGVISAQGVLNSSGVATFTLATGLTGGTHTLQADYLGTNGYDGSTSPALTVSVSTAPTTSTLVIAPPNINPYSAVSGAAVTFTVTVNSTGVGIPTGTVTFTTGSTSVGAALLEPAAGGAFQASLTTTTLPVGTDLVTATYSGDANYVGSAASGTVYVVAAPLVIPTSSGSTLTSSQSSNTTVTFTNTSYGGWSGIIGYHCLASSLPVNAICVFSPGEVTLNASTAANSYLPATTTLHVVVDNPPNSPVQNSILWWMGGLTGVLLLFVRRRAMQGAWGRVSMIIGAALLAVSATGLMACNSGIAYPTPAGASTITVIANSDPFAVKSDGTTDTTVTQACTGTVAIPATPCAQATFQVSLTVK